jgi:hypothetical protein
LIDMETADHREKVYRALQEALRTDKARTNILKISELGLVEMTRKRTRENLLQVLCESCSYCEGRGFVLSRKSVAFKVLREVRNDLPRFSSRRIAISVNPLVAEQLLRDGQKGVVQLGEELGREIEVRARPGIHQEQFEVTALDAGPPVSIPLRWLDGTRPSAEVEDGENKRPRRGRGRRGGGRGAAAENAEGQEDENTQGAAEMTEAAEASASEATESPKGISEESAAVESPTETSEPKTPVVAAEAASTPEPESETPRGAATGTKSVRTPARRTSASLIATMSSLDDDDVPEEQPESPLEAEPVELNPEIKPEASRASGGAAAAEVPEEFESPAIETPEVLDGEPEMRILPGSRKPEES